MMGATWGDGDAARIHVPTPRPEVGPVAAAGPALERALADLRRSLDQWHHGKVGGISVIDATRAYLAALDAEGADPP
jgi:hypothetical protein